jgi:hypothetical protein
VSIQALHYLTLCILIPSLLTFFANPVSLTYEGGASNVGVNSGILYRKVDCTEHSIGMIMDWRELAGQPTVRGLGGPKRWDTLSGVWSGSKHIGHKELGSGAWDGRVDPTRGWIIALCWMTAFSVEYVFLLCTTNQQAHAHLSLSIGYLYFLVRRPRLILDFVLTLLFNHLVFTTYYSASVPTSIFFWAIMGAGTALMIIVAEQLCVRREMQEGLAVPTVNTEDDIEMSGLLSDRRD